MRIFNKQFKKNPFIYLFIYFAIKRHEFYKGIRLTQALCESSDAPALPYINHEAKNMLSANIRKTITYPTIPQC